MRLTRFISDLSELSLGSTMKTTFANPDDILNFQLTIEPDEGMYKGGSFVFTFAINQNFPHDPPKVKCTQKIYHPNIDLEGNVCLNILREDWKPVLNLNAVIIGMQVRSILQSTGGDRGTDVLTWWNSSSSSSPTLLTHSTRRQPKISETTEKDSGVMHEQQWAVVRLKARATTVSCDDFCESLHTTFSMAFTIRRYYVTSVTQGIADRHVGQVRGGVGVCWLIFMDRKPSLLQSCPDQLPWLQLLTK